jgi:glycosyltransferase involved in cell wall biosynthesis
MRLCFIADLNSIHSQKFIGFFARKDYEVLVLSTGRSRSRKYLGAQVVNLPGGRLSRDNLRYRLKGSLRYGTRAFDRLARAGLQWNQGLHSHVIAQQIDRFTPSAVQSWLDLYDASREAARALIHEYRPDLLQCLRLPVEGFIGAHAEYTPTVHFCWGNDLTLWASSHPEFAALTRPALAACSGFLADCQRDEQLARDWGLSSSTPVLVTPSGGGLDTAHLADAGQAYSRPHRDKPLVFLSLRGSGGHYVDNLPVVRAIPSMCKLIGKRFVVRFAGHRGAYYDLLRSEAQRLGVADRTEFVAPVSHNQIGSAIVQADLIFSATYHDGTPNSLLETMWFGGIPIYSDLESTREWIADGVNGYLIDMGDPEQIATTFARAVAEQDSHNEFRAMNRAIIKERADYQTCMTRVEQTYLELTGQSRKRGRR